MRVRLVCDPEQIERDLLKELAKVLQKGVTRAVPGITNSLGKLIEEGLLQSPEYKSITTDQLWHELGVIDGEAATVAIIATIRKNMRVTNLGVRVRGKSVTGGLRIEILRGDFADVLALPEASFYSYSRRRGTSYHVTWLEWLLLEGTSMVVQDFQYSPGHEKSSRTGYGIMVSGEGWHVPEEFRGTREDNWLTRGLQVINPASLERVLRVELAKV